MNKKWEYEYNNNHIEVINKATHEELYINDQKVDEHNGIGVGVSLHGALNNGEQVLAVLRSEAFSVNCELYIVKEKLEEKISN